MLAVEDHEQSHRWALAAGLGVFALLVAFSPSLAASTWSPRAAILLVAGALGTVPLMALARRGDVAAVLLLTWCVVSALSAITSPQPALSTVGLHNWGTGALFVFALAGVWALGRRAHPSIRSSVTRWIVIGAVVNAVVAVVQRTAVVDVFPFVSDDGRTAGLLGNPLHLASVSLAALGLVAFRPSTGRALAGGCAIVLGVAIELSGSRGGLLLLTTAAVVASLRRRWRASAIFALALVAALGVAALTATGSGSASGSRARLGEGGGSLVPRVATWRAALEGVTDHGVIGVGPGRFRAATVGQRTLEVARAEGGDRLFVDAHNLLVEYLVTTGVGVVPLAGALAVSLWRGRGELLAGSLLLCGMHLVSPQSVATTPLLFLGAAMSGASPSAGVPTGRWVRLGNVVLLAAAVTAAFALLRGDYLLNEARLDVELADARAAERLLPPWPQPAHRIAIAHAFRAQAFNSPRDEHEALRWLREAARRSPDDPSRWSALAARQAQNGLTREAEASYRRALSVNRYSPLALRGLARLYERDGRAEAAGHLYARLLEVEPRTPVAAPASPAR